MSDKLRIEINKSLTELAKNTLDQPLENLIEPLEEVYEKLLLADYIEKRNSRKDALQKRVLKSLETEIDSQPIVTKKAAEGEDANSHEEAQEKFSMTPEIKIVPHPEGPPPMPNQEPEEEEVVVEAKTPEPVKVVASPKVEAKKSEKNEALNIAEKAQSQPQQKSLHAKIAAQNLSFGLNDRLAYVKHLFEGNTEDFNRVVSQINTFESYGEANEFIEEMVKPDFNWGGKEEYEERFLSQIKGRFE